MEDVTPTLQEVVTTDTELKEWLVITPITVKLRLQ